MKTLAISLLLLTLTACTSAPTKTTSAEVTTTYECYGTDPNLATPLNQANSLQQMLHDQTDLTGIILNCNGSTLIVETILDYGPDEVNILDRTTGRWQTQRINDCQVISHEAF